MKSRIINPATGKPFVRHGSQSRGTPRTPIMSRYDAAGTTKLDARHWAAADCLSAAAANSLDVRKKLRERARYEFGSNGYCEGLVLTMANDLVGTGPTLQLLTDSDEVNRQVEEAFGEWAEGIGLAEKLHTLKEAKMRDGEAFALFVNNPKSSNPVQLDVLDIECDLVTAPFKRAMETSPLYIDGIEFDRNRNPIRYDVMEDHPGDVGLGLGGWGGDFQTLERFQVLHWFRVDRPGQVRGIPEITPSLPLFAQLRRFILATLSSAEVAASFSAVLENESAEGDEEEAIEGDPFEMMEIVRNMMTLLPAGHKMKQFEAAHPGATFEMFKREMLKEIGRPVNAGLDVVGADTSPFNYSSAKLSRGLYQVSLRVERNSCRRNVLERIFQTWFAEARLAGVLPFALELKTLRRDWYWPGTTSIEPLKEAKANTENLANGTTTLAELAAEEGKDWQARMRQRAKEKRLERELGLEGQESGGRGQESEAPPEEEEEVAALHARIDELEERLWTVEGRRVEA